MERSSLYQRLATFGGILFAAVATGSPANDATADAAPSEMVSVPADMRWEPSWREKADCGPMGLFVLMRMMGSDVPLGEVKSHFSVDPERGCSLADVARAATELGFAAEARFLDFKELTAIDGPCICHLNGSVATGTGHFMPIVCYSASKRQFAIVRSDLEQLLWVPEKTISKHFSGYALVPSNNVWSASAPVRAVWLFGAGLAFFIISRRRPASTRLAQPALRIQTNRIRKFVAR